MNQTLNLETQWLVRHEELYMNASDLKTVAGRSEGWLSTSLPCDVRMALIAHGVIAEPQVGDNAKESRWVEEKSWWFKKDFAVTPEQLENDVAELVLDSLDVEADVFLNGFHLAHHRSAHYAFVQDVKRHLVVGINSLLVRVTTGLEHVNGEDLAPIAKCVAAFEDGTVSPWSDRTDKRRVFLRKAQYSFGWDFGPRLASCGIMGGAAIHFHNKFTVRSVYAATRSLRSPSAAHLEFQVEIEGFHPYSSFDANLSIEVFDPENKKTFSLTRDVFVKSGINYIDVTAEIASPQLWWPVGMGDPSLYTARISLANAAVRVDYPEFKFGIRTVRLVTDKLDGGRDETGNTGEGCSERDFAFEINGKRLFIKGANWVPPDTIFARNTAEKFETLILEAKASNTNLLRVWGGGIYEPDVFYEKCDEHGMLVWQDFMFVCGLYPDHLAWFREEVEREMDYQTRRLRNHPSIALWCGNNENFWHIEEYYVPHNPPFLGGTRCYNELGPRVVRRNCPEVPYWNGSPYGGKNPNSPLCGDAHMYGRLYNESQSGIHPEGYDNYNVRFASEFSTKGPVCLKSTLEYLGDTNPEPDRESLVWDRHTNWIAYNLVEAAIDAHYTDHASLDLANYLLLGGIWEGIMLGYAIEALRRRPVCEGLVYWKIDDPWGEIGSGIIDYYLRRKVPFYFVRRAYAERIFIMRKEGEHIEIVCHNDTDTPLRVPVEYGYTRFDGTIRQAEQATVELPPRTKKTVLELAFADHDTRKGIYFVAPLDPSQGILPATLRTGVFKDLEVTRPQLKTFDFTVTDDDVAFTVKSDVFAHAVHFNLDADIRLSDEFFDLLPNEERRIVAYGVAGKLSAGDVCAASIFVV